MSSYRTTVLGAVVAATVGLTACNSMPMSGTTTMMTRMTGASEVPAVMTDAFGSVETSYNLDTHMLRWTVTYSGLSGPATGGHFHGPAMPGQNAPVVIPFTGSLASPISGGVILTPAQAADLLAGRWYVNLHTVANPNGEIRGQVVSNNQ